MIAASLAQRLAEARHRASVVALDTSDAVEDVESAYQIQEQLAALGPDEVAGWKVTALAAADQAKFASTRPVAGALLHRYVHKSPARLALDSLVRPWLECEVAFALAADLPPRAQPYSLDEVAAAVAGVLASFEIVDSRVPPDAPELLKLADCMSNGAFVTALQSTDRTALDLTAIAITLTHDGREVARGESARILGNPLLALLALANAQPLPTGGLKAGQIVTTGTCTTPSKLERGTYRAEFIGLGAIELTVS